LFSLPEKEARMTNMESEAALDALLLLGYAVEISDSGAITARLGSDVIEGQATAGTIEWRDRSAMFRVRERAYIVKLRARVHAAQVAASRGPALEREGPEAHQATVPRSGAQK
jgi:hypothetical protein